MLCSITLVTGLFSNVSHAQKRLKFSNTEDVAIAYYKTGNKIPNFEKWIKDREPYKITPWAAREKEMTNEMARLQLAYKQFNPEEDYLLIRTSVQLMPLIIKNKTGKNTYTLNATFAKAQEALYFPYEFLDERIVVMPYKLEKLMNSPLEKSQFEYITDSLRGKESTMIIRMKAREADFSRPYKIDGLQQWVFKTDIVTMEIWNWRKQLIWEYSVPWYVSPNTRELNTLFNNKPEQSPFQGSVKPLITAPE